MNPKSLGIGGLIALAALALIAIVASNPLTSQASTHEPTDTGLTAERLSTDISSQELNQPEEFDLLQGTEEETDDSDPYIGVQIVELDDGSVKVVRVVTGGPSDGVLMQGDVITAVDGTTIDGSSDLVDTITEAGTDTTISLTITRDGSSQTVDVTIGDRGAAPTSLRGHRSGRIDFLPRFGSLGSGKGMKKHLGIASGNVVNSQVVVENDDGTFSTHRKVIGTVSNLDTSAGTFTLTPKDGSDAIDYKISDDTKVLMNRNGDLGPLNTEDDTLVVDVDGDVTLVQQGVLTKYMGHSYRGGKRFGLRDIGRWYVSDRDSVVDSVFEALRSRFPDRS